MNNTLKQILTATTVVAFTACGGGSGGSTSKPVESTGDSTINSGSTTEDNDTGNGSTNTTRTTTEVEIDAVVHNVSNVSEFRKALEDSARNHKNDKIVLAEGIYRTTSDSLGRFTFSDDEDYNLSIVGKEGIDRSKIVLDGDNKNQVLELLNTKSSGNSIIRLKNLSIINGFGDKASFRDGYPGPTLFYSANMAALVTKSMRLELDNVKLSNNNGGESVIATFGELYGNKILVSDNSNDGVILFSEKKSNTLDLKSTNNKALIFFTSLDNIVMNKANISTNHVTSLVRSYKKLDIKNSDISQNTISIRGLYGLSIDMINTTLNNNTHVSKVVGYDSQYPEHGELMRGSEGLISQCSILNNKNMRIGTLGTVVNTKVSNNTLDSSTTQGVFEPFINAKILKRSRIINNHIVQATNDKSHNPNLLSITRVAINNYFYNNNVQNYGAFANIKNSINNTFYKNTLEENLLLKSEVVLNTIILNNNTKWDASVSRVLRNSYISYRRLEDSVDNGGLIKKDNLESSTIALNINENGAPGLATSVLNRGLNPDSSEFSEVFGDSTFQVTKEPKFYMTEKEYYKLSLQKDLLGNIRVHNGVIDIGAVENIN